MLDVLYLGLVLGHGGDAFQMLDLATGVARSGRRVRIVLPEIDTSRGFADRAKELGVDVERTPLLQLDLAGVSPGLRGVVRVLRRHRAKVLHVHSGGICLPRKVLLAFELLNVRRIVATIHSPYQWMRPGSLRARMWAASVAWRFDKVVCPSMHACRAQMRYGVPEKRIHLIRNCVDVRRFQQGDPARARAALGLDADVPLIVFSSRLEPQKRPLEALAAFSKIAPEFPQAHLVYVGRGALEEEAKAAARASHANDRVHFVGHQSNIPDWLAAATIWSLPTESENFSVALIEALAAGCPVVSTLCPGNDEVLRDGVNALTPAIGDVDGQASAFRRLLGDAHLRAKLGEGARETAREFTVDRMVSDYEALYAAALSS